MAYSAVEKTDTPARSILPAAEMLFKEQEVVGKIGGPPAVSCEDGTLSFLFRAEAVRSGEKWFCSDSTFRVYIKKPLAEAAYGERWRIKGRYRSYAESRAGLDGSYYATEAIRLREAGPSFKAVCYKARDRAAQSLRVGMESFPEQVQLLSALLLGYRNALSPELYQTFAYTGTLHIFAISGLHVGVLAAILIAVLKMIGVSRPRWGLVLIPALLFYVVSTGMKPSAFRAFTMAAVYFAAPLVRRRPDPASSIALSALILLVMNPFQIRDPGFLLSFTVVTGIVMVHGYALRRLTGFSRPGWAIPLAQLSGPRPIIALLRTMGLLTLTSVAAWIFSAPLTARFFNTLSPVALAGNLVIIPLTFLIVLTGCLTLVTAPALFSVAIVFNHANRVFITLLIASIKRMGDLPGATIFVRSPAPVVLFLWYTGLILFLTGTPRIRRVAILCILGSVLFWGGGMHRPFSGIEVYKEGETATIIRGAPSRWILVTDGSSYGTRRTIRRLQKEGVNRLHALVVSDRWAEAESIEKLYRSFSPEQVWMIPDLQKGPLAETLREAGLPLVFSKQSAWEIEGGILSTSLGH